VQRKIIHIDMDAFFASVEQRDNPELRGKPVAVGGSGRRGVVAAASYEARKFGVRSAMPGMTAARLCPELIFVRARFDAYKQVSQQIREIFFDYTDLVEPLSLDEAYLDVTENKKSNPSATLIAQEIRSRIFETTGLTASAGVSFNKFLAKVASDINKPNGIKVITPPEANHFLITLPVEKFHGIGKVTAKKMHQLGIHNGADLQAWSKEDLVRLFGKSGGWYYHVVRAEDNRAVCAEHVYKSVSVEETFMEDYDDLSILSKELNDLTERLFKRLVRHGEYGKTLTLKIKNAAFQSITRSRTFPHELKDPEDVFKFSLDLLEKNMVSVGKIRLLGIGLSNFPGEKTEGKGIQLELDLE
jgi:DNA polymerase-4